MKNFISSITEILEVDAVKDSDKLESFDSWDSLTILSIIAFCESEYMVVLSAEEIENAETIFGLRDLIKNKM